MADIFLSYSRKDSEVMKQVNQHLTSRGFSVWTDEGLSVGTPDWQAAIEVEIEKAKGFVVILSPSHCVNYIAIPIQKSHAVVFAKIGRAVKLSPNYLVIIIFRASPNKIIFSSNRCSLRKTTKGIL